jgi:hypothetical protein
MSFVMFFRGFGKRIAIGLGRAGITVCAGTTDSREGLIGADTGREDKEGVVKCTRAVNARGIYRGLGRNARAD